MAVLAFTEGRTSYREPLLFIGPHGAEVLVGMLVPTVLVAILAARVSANFSGQLGYLGEQLLQSNRLPQLNIPTSNGG
ncbi:MAG: hypothetical protein VKO01_06460 [Cyanobacteriota bacterium]|jgi:hypothetical protein|nr:hypothetical protein [Cyanobacteriota bacterium]